MFGNDKKGTGTADKAGAELNKAGGEDQDAVAGMGGGEGSGAHGAHDNSQTQAEADGTVGPKSMDLGDQGAENPKKDTDTTNPDAIRLSGDEANLQPGSLAGKEGEKKEETEKSYEEMSDEEKVDYIFKDLEGSVSRGGSEQMAGTHGELESAKIKIKRILNGE